MMEVVVTTGATRHAKLHVKLSPPTNRNQTFYRLDALPFAQPMVLKHLMREWIFTLHTKFSSTVYCNWSCLWVSLCVCVGLLI